MARYLIQSPHMAEECLQTLDDIVARSPEAITRWDFGCAAGDHSNHMAYMVTEAQDASAALTEVPEKIRGKAQATEVGRLTADQVKAFHN